MPAFGKTKVRVRFDKFEGPTAVNLEHVYEKSLVLEDWEKPVTFDIKVDAAKWEKIEAARQTLRDFWDEMNRTFTPNYDESYRLLNTAARESYNEDEV